MEVTAQLICSTKIYIGYIPSEILSQIKNLFYFAGTHLQYFGQSYPRIKKVSMETETIIQHHCYTRAVEIPCPTCTTWSRFIQDKLKISIYLSLDKYKMYKVNVILNIMFWLIITSSHITLKTLWILISWLLKKPADLDLHCLQESSGFILFS